MPKYCQQYNNTNTNTDMVETFETALNASFKDIKKNEIDVAFVYYPNIDNLGHKFGPDSDEIKKEVKLIDGVFDRLLTTIADENMNETINFIVVADHGMTNNSKFVSRTLEINTCTICSLKLWDTSIFTGFWHFLAHHGGVTFTCPSAELT